MTEQYSWKNEERCPILKDVELNGKSVYTSPGSEKDFSSFIKFKIDLTKSYPRRISNHIITLYMDYSPTNYCYDFFLSVLYFFFTRLCSDNDSPEEHDTAY